MLKKNYILKYEFSKGVKSQPVEMSIKLVV